MTKTKTILILLSIIAFGLFLRAYNINHVPPGVYPDEAVNGIDAVTAVKTGHFQWFYPSNNGREGLFVNIMAVCFKFLGVSVFTLKLTSIIFGTLAIWGIYLLGTELFENKRLGLISAFLLAVSFWSINFSRIAFRAIMVPTVLIFSFYFLFRGLRTKKWYDFAIGGFIFGLGLHTYIAFRIAPVILVIMFFILLLTREKFLQKFWKLIIVFILFTTLSAAPMLYTFFVSHPEYWQSRTSEISILNPKVNQGHLFMTFLKTFGLSLAKYNFWGDQNWRQNFPPYAILDPLTGIAFLFGLIYSIVKFFQLLLIRFKKKVRHPRLEAYTFLLSTFFIMLVPEFLAAEGNPHALRSIGTMPAVFIFSALTFNFFFESAKKRSYIFQKVTAFLIILMFLSIGVFNTLKYHVVWARRPETAHAFDKNLTEISTYLKTLPLHQEKFIITGNMGRIPIKLFSQSLLDLHYVYPGQIQYISPQKHNHFIIILTDYNRSIISQLKNKFPALKLTEKKDKLGMSFWILK